MVFNPFLGQVFILHSSFLRFVVVLFSYNDLSSELGNATEGNDINT